MLDFKFVMLKKLQQLNDETILPDDTLTTLIERRMAVAKDIMGSLGDRVKIEPASSLPGDATSSLAVGFISTEGRSSSLI